MPAIYLSPSTQDWNRYVTGSGSEEYQMNRIADALEPWLRANTIRFQRNRPEMTAAESIRQANRGEWDLYLALHSNASPEGRYGENRGILVFHYPGSREGRRAAELIAEELRQIYPLPGRVSLRPTRSLGEVSRSRAPAVLAEIGYHDNREDALWIEGHTENIARQLAAALTRFFDLPLIQPQKPRRGRVAVGSGRLNLRDRPSPEGRILAGLPNGTEVTVLGAWQGWYAASCRGISGYAAAAYIDL